MRFLPPSGARRSPARALALLAATWLAAASLDSAQQQPTFRSTVDLIAVDVQVVDGNGRPLTGLDTNNFDVEIDGRRRRVVSSVLVEHDTSGQTRQIGSGPVASNDLPSSGGPGRTFVLAVDTDSFEPGNTLPIVQAMRGFVDRLQLRDQVGLLILPFGARVEPTMDRAVLRKWMDTIVGQQQAHQGQFHLSTSEILDINAEAASLTIASTQQLAQAAGRGTPVPTATDTETLQRVQLRECRRTSDLGCIEGIISEAATLAHSLEERIRRGIGGLDSLLDLLRTLPDRKTVVLVSAGMPVSDRPGGRVDIGDEAKSLGEQAAHANASIYALHIDFGFRETYTAQARRPRDAGVSVARERNIGAKLLDEFAGASGGALLPVPVGSGEIALGRVLLETSAYYMLGVEPSNIDRDGKAHQLKVKVNQRGAVVRSRQWVVIRPSKSGI
jgi:VWFA-related protein